MGAGEQRVAGEGGVSKTTTATHHQCCVRCGDAIAPGARMQRGCHWRCYMAAWRAHELAALPLAQVGRPVRGRRAAQKRVYANRAAWDARYDRKRKARARDEAARRLAEVLHGR